MNGGGDSNKHDDNNKKKQQGGGGRGWESEIETAPRVAVPHDQGNEANEFTIMAIPHEFTCRAGSQEEMLEWVRAIQDRLSGEVHLGSQRLL